MILYKSSKSGKIQVWSIEKHSTNPSFRTSEGFLDGKITPTAYTTCESMNVGRANETSPDEQTIKEMEARITKQKNKGWVEDVNQVQQAKDELVSPMLAHKFNEKRSFIANKPIASQPKLDGSRCSATVDKLFTRTGKLWVACPHIQYEAELLLAYIGISGAKLDGEFYNSDLKNDFNKLISLVKKTKPTEADLAESKEVIRCFY